MNARTINAVVWLYLWLSRGCTPVTDIPEGSSFWAEKSKQFFEFGPFDDIAMLLGRGVFFLIPWLGIHLMLRKSAAKQGTAQPES